MLDEDRVSKERNVIKQEISRGQTDLTLVNTWQFNSMMMNKKGNLINPLIGSVNQMDKISRRDLAVFYESLNKQKVYIVSSGPQDIETLSGFFRRMFSDDKVSVRLENNIINKPEMRAVIKMQEGKDDSIFLKLGARIGVDSYIKDQAAIELLAEYLGGHNGKLLQTLRYEAGLVYAVQVVCYCFNKLGCFYIGTDCSKNDLPLAISRVSDEIYKVKNGNLDNNRLATIKAMLVKRLRRNFEKSEFISMSHIPHAFNPALLDRVAMVNAIGRVATDDLQRVANEYLNDKNLLWSLAGNIRLDDIDLPGIAKSEVILN